METLQDLRKHLKEVESFHQKALLKSNEKSMELILAPYLTDRHDPKIRLRDAILAMEKWADIKVAEALAKQVPPEPC